MENSCYWIWLQCALSQGSGLISDILETYGGPREFYEAVQSCDLARGLERLPAATPAVLRKCKNTPLSAARTVMDHCEKAGCGILCYDHPDYPDRLRYIYAPPAVLYYRGTLAGLDEIPVITVVGTRSMTEYGRKAAIDFGSSFAGAGIGVASGMAVGIDITAMKAALKQGGYVIGIMGCGLDVNYPAENEKMRELTGKYGCLLSEYPPGTGVRKGNFPVRNRIMAGLGLGVLVVQAPARSGSLITADHALEQGKDLFVVPGGLYDASTAGNLRLLRDGCIPVTEPGDVVDFYRPQYRDVLQRELRKNKARLRAARNLPDDGEPPEKSAKAHKKPLDKQTRNEAADGAPQAPAEPKVSEPSLAVYRALTQEPAHLEVLAEVLGMRVSEVLCAVTELEIAGAIRSYAGRRYAKKGENPSGVFH